MVLWRQAALVLSCACVASAALQTSSLPAEDYSFLCTGVVDYEYVLPEVRAACLHGAVKYRFKT
jgi:hypothetical protein